MSFKALRYQLVLLRDRNEMKLLELSQVGDANGSEDLLT